MPTSTRDRDRAERRLARRRAGVPKVSYPPQLPVSQRREEIANAIRDHQVVVVAGETGSGKTTQLPKICLELGRGVAGMIGHTQPRRLAARTVAERVAAELRTPLGQAVGYQVRFTDRVGPDTLVKLMTDGILLAELARDRMLRRYDTIIIDEAHERSLNVDFLLGYLARLLPHRPDLKLVITSATIDPERFSRHFGGAPVVEVSGRTYPVEVRYRPLGEDPDDDRDQVQGIVDAVDELCREGPGDILVFLSGEREIRDTAEVLRGHRFPRSPGGVEILPLYARLATADQRRVFQPHAGRRVVLATNVAETSLTVPGIKYVVDPGTARISRYSHRSKVQRLPIEPISQASANQRKGRCGRTSDGICIRLYTEDDFNARPAFTDPEILRTNLASVILQMTSLGLGDLAAFPFIDPPDRRSVKAGVDLLQELGALQESGRLTPVGRRLAQLPVDPRLARMVVEADRRGCTREVLVIAAALSIQDPRERPVEAQQAADERHGRFADKQSDFLTWLNLWRFVHERQAELSSNQFRKLCRAEFLNYLRVREWQDLHGQLRAVARDLGVKLNRDDPHPDAVHTALLAGLLSHIGLKQGDTRDYLGARGTRFAIFPGSALARKPPRWVMAAELVETSRLWGRVAAAIQPEWIEPLAGHLVKRSYAEPHWSRSRGAVLAAERVTLYGVPIVAGHQVNYGRIDPELSRELFLRHALVEGDWETGHEFFARNRRLLAEVEELEHRARRRDILVDDHTLFDFYDRRVPPEVVSARHFDAWWKQASRDRPDLLDFERSMLIEDAADAPDARDYPDTWVAGGHRLRLTYQFEPGSDADGVTVHLPLAVLNQIDPAGFDWQVPGLRQELVTELIRSLPKAIRRNFIPAPNWAESVLQRVGPGDGPLLEVLARELERTGPVEVSPADFDLAKVPDHLRVTFRVAEPTRRGPPRVLGEGKDLEELKARLAPRMRAAIAAAAPGLERDRLAGWDLGTLPRVVEQPAGGGRVVRGFPALVDEGDGVAVRLLETEAEQAAAMWAGTRRLLLQAVPSPVRHVLGRQSNQAKLTLSRYRHGSATELFADCLAAAADDLIAANGGPAWDEPGFARLLAAVRAGLADATLDVVTKVARALAVAGEVEGRLAELTNPAFAPTREDLRAQLDALVYPGWVTATGRRRLPDVHRYLLAMVLRLDRLPADLARDAERMESVAYVTDAWRRALDRAPSPELAELRWTIEELRVSYFAQTLGTPHPVSEKRVLRAIDRLGE